MHFDDTAVDVQFTAESLLVEVLWRAEGQALYGLP